ncbi:MarR family transcriptional regulator [Sphingobium sp. Sx8-8]|uniref:MarR family winged helix-turn-helix transcriptional regulator n=1 Tax=Sphingobium sp. Sx8-8 TaxID=2933617 RepID=UPI001F56E64D|nr:MarR family transcriptional regulator [Sphingobium sp. Sx8-8]
MSDEPRESGRDGIGVWTKRCYFAGRAVMDSALRPYELGSVQWYVLHQLVHDGPTMQRDLVRLLGIERATMTSLVATLVRKGLVEQESDKADQRQRLLRITPTGAKLWGELPDLSFIRSAAFDGIDEADIATVVRVLRAATERLENISRKGTLS